MSAGAKNSKGMRDPHGMSHQSGMSLIEVLIGIAIFSVVITTSAVMFRSFDLYSKKIESESASESESLVWMGRLRKSLYISLESPESPPEMPKLERSEISAGGSRGIRYDYKLADVSYSEKAIFSIRNTCSSVSESAKKYFPGFSSEYLAKMMVRLIANSACVNDLASLSCPSGTTVKADFTLDNRSYLHFPAFSANPTNWKNTRGNVIAGMVCLVRSPNNYLLVQMMSATIDSTLLTAKDPLQAIQWRIHKMTLPPPNNGNSQYVRN